METFRIEIKGDRITPDFFPIEKLTLLLNSINRTIKSEVKKEYPYLKTNDLVLSLTKIESGSVRPIFYSPYIQIYNAYRKIIWSLINNIYEQLDLETLKELKKISDFSKKNNLTIYFYHKEKNLGPAIISKDTVIKLPVKYIISGYSKLFGKLVFVGGIPKPKAKIELFDNRTIKVNLSEDDAKKIAKKLYEIVQVEGESIWDYENWEVSEFNVKNILPFDDTTLEDAFNELSKSINGFWKNPDINVVKEVEKIRGIV